MLKILKKDTKKLKKYEWISDRSWEIINRIADEPSLNPDKPRKTREERVDDLAYWLKKYRYLNSSYNECGMDVQGFNQWDEYVDHHCGHLEAFKHYPYYTVKNSLIPRPLNAVLSDDKFVFSAFISSIPGGDKLVPQIYLYIKNGVVVAGPGEIIDPVIAICGLPTGKYVCKPTLGQCGRDILLIELEYTI